MAEITKKIIERYKPEDLQTRASRSIPKNFGIPEDFVEMYVCDLNDQIILADENFLNYTLDNKTGNLSKEIIFDPVRILTVSGYNSGVFNIKVNVQRHKIRNTASKIFFIKEISPSRTELRVGSNVLEASDMTDVYIDYANDSTSALFFKDFNLNFGRNRNIIGINLALDQVIINEEHDLLIKLYEPLPDEFDVNNSFKITEEIINPVEYRIDLGDFVSEQILGAEIKGPNFRLDTRLNNPTP